MLHPETPFPYVGSYALLVDPEAAAPQAAELVRIQMRREGEVVVSFPLRDGARGNKRVDPVDLINATALTAAEAREFHDLDRALHGRTSFHTKRQKAEKARRDYLRRRMIHAPIIDRLLRDLRERETAERARRAA